MKQSAHKGISISAAGAIILPHRRWRQMSIEAPTLSSSAPTEAGTLAHKHTGQTKGYIYRPPLYHEAGSRLASASTRFFIGTHVHIIVGA